MNAEWPDRQKVVFLFNLVREIPYGNIGVREVQEVLSRKQGSCSGKHVLLGQLYELASVPVKYMMGMTDLQLLNSLLPADRRIREPVYDFHNFLKIRIAARWRVVDATFDSALGPLGLPINYEWSGKSDCRLAFAMTDVAEVADIVASKKQALASLSKHNRLRRKQAFKNLMDWIADYRKRQGCADQNPTSR